MADISKKLGVFTSAIAKAIRKMEGEELHLTFVGCGIR
jgi:Mn-dependent DtxR family transcriptional regulator